MSEFHQTPKGILLGSHEVSPDVHWVKPVVPTVLGDLDQLPVPGTDLIFASLDGGWFFPGPLDFEMLKKAFAATLHDYPHAAGRLRSDPKTGKWRIALTNSAVPITFNRTSVDPRPEVEFMQEWHPDFLDQLPWSFAPTSNNDEPLLRCKYTYWEATNESSFAASWCHVLGDGLALFQFCDNLHHHYLGLQPRTMPTFEKYTAQPPTLEQSALVETIPLVPHLAIDYAPEHFFAMYTQMLDSTCRVDLQFTKDQLQKMRAMAERHARVKISTQDALVAYLITVLNRTERVPARWLMNVVNYRGVKAAAGFDYTPPPGTSAGNITLTSFSDKIPEEAKLDLGLIATVVRDTVTKLERESLPVVVSMGGRGGGQ
ncbi:hypothetical protein PUNSTDRAFT_131668 [Punctularia strigosozonata HHB-11173 SS5]|uniref:uncharacterized protein n=1 Tax=Punctularia strigosozonata (strain HHB-11173) TaxID=741275 RepID=UPI0004416F58|nr:uncharacterized protein PUNSTDRAFT_131668 [Punctularia strigosozonata HHB-11173 SS5]EIN11503.1 hypothetical protein PUNSTDRAFT_131668 [Punctularia strigosozonata HHB-11173 SS5]